MKEKSAPLKWSISLFLLFPLVESRKTFNFVTELCWLRGAAYGLTGTEQIIPYLISPPPTVLIPTAVSLFCHLKEGAVPHGFFSKGKNSFHHCRPTFAPQFLTVWWAEAQDAQKPHHKLSFKPQHFDTDVIDKKFRHLEGIFFFFIMVVQHIGHSPAEHLGPCLTSNMRELKSSMCLSVSFAFAASTRTGGLGPTVAGESFHKSLHIMKWLRDSFSTPNNHSWRFWRQMN